MTLLLLLTSTLPVLAQPVPTDDMYRAGRFDNGKMWTFDYPPTDYLAETYQFKPDESWFTSARLGALRIPGCTASFVSAHGLVMTNHHCGRGATAAVSQPGENLLEEGFYATSLAEERRADNMYADQLFAIEDVTDEVYAALENAQTDAERAQARQDVIEQIQTRIGEAAGGEDAGMHVEVISLYHGGRYSAYTFKRYDDVRLVMVPEVEVGYYGGDADNFTYPRYVLDMTFFRVYENGEPYETLHYFQWSEAGVEEGSLVFAIGNPGSTYRLETVAQLNYRRDVREPTVLHFYRSRADALQDAYDGMPEGEGKSELQNQIFSLRNGQKLYEGRVRALNNEMIMARRADTERQLREAINADASLQAEYGNLIDEMVAVQAQKAELGPEYGAFLLISNPNFSSATLQRAILAYRYLTEQQSGATDEALARMREQLLAVTDQPESIDKGLLTIQLADMEWYLGENHDIAQNALDGQEPAT
ncbi:MAG TPA: S46 family peptidase, partial [Rhodothermales bacterium]|nr:S46 family peptidase [Rhodothermales bacterium]